MPTAKPRWCFHYSPKKLRYPDRLDAHIALTMAQLHGRSERRYYFHPLCRGWHLTSMEEFTDGR